MACCQDPTCPYARYECQKCASLMHEISDRNRTITALQEQVRELRRQVTMARENNEARNRALDALHYVWCDGGCAYGVHRYQHPPLTEEIMEEARRNMKRLETHWRNKKDRRKYEETR